MNKAKLFPGSSLISSTTFFSDMLSGSNYYLKCLDNTMKTYGNAMKGFKQHSTYLVARNVALSIFAWMVEGWYFQTGIDQTEYGSYLWEAVEELSLPVTASWSRLFVKVTRSWFFILLYEKLFLLSQGQVLCSAICNIFSIPCSHWKGFLCPLHLE